MDKIFITLFFVAIAVLYWLNVGLAKNRIATTVRCNPESDKKKLQNLTTGAILVTSVIVFLIAILWILGR